MSTERLMDPQHQDVKFAPPSDTNNTDMHHDIKVSVYDPQPIDHKRSRYPYCIVWTPIPFLTWIFPFIGHMGIATSSGIIRDFAGPYFVSEDDMGFGKPTKYWMLDHNKAKSNAWDISISEASEEYKTRMHNLCCDNCHSHVAMALNLMQYKRQSWNMVKLCFLMLIYGRYVGLGGFLKTWLPSVILYGIVVTLVLVV
ncbi:transmembrane protein 222-like [Acanthaster planci]|uniref:Transmembrane protein 222-like n=1 Tax=Acanthaster planci TaxID=133434 RepID=A0A8B7ZF79_ACAPL|nr:transmembrane protein 222-like [Acanthaster planci]